jgi:hypothetical protein
MDTDKHELPGRARHSVRAVAVKMNILFANSRLAEDCPPYPRHFCVHPCSSAYSGVAATRLYAVFIRGLIFPRETF